MIGDKMAIYYDPDRARGYPGRLEVCAVHTPLALAAAVETEPRPQLVVLGPGVALSEALSFAAGQRIERPALGVVLLRDQVEIDVLVEAIKSGVREVVPAGDPAAADAACDRSLQVSRQLEAAVRAAGVAEPAAEGKVITVFAGKGGCGKSTVAINLALTLAAAGRRRVCLIDLDLQFGDVGIMLQLAPERGLADAVSMAGRLDADGVRSLLTKYRPGLDILLAPPGPAEGDHITRDLVSELIKVARPMFDYIVVDTPPYFTDQVLQTLDLTDRFVLVISPDLPTLKSVRLTLDMFELLGYPADRRVAVLNRADSQVGLSVSDVEKAIRTPMSVLVPSSRDVPISINRGNPLVSENPHHPFSRAIAEIADRCGDHFNAKPTRHRRAARRFFSWRS